MKRKMLQRVVEASNDPAMARDCGPEVEALCFDSPPGAGNLHRCLFVDHYNYLSEVCQERELKYQAMKRTDVALNPLLMAHCQPVLDKYCAKLSGGGPASSGTLSAQMKCLEAHADSLEATPACRSRVLQEPILRSKSLLLNPDVATACAADFTELFATGRCLAVGLLNLPQTASGVAKELGGRDLKCLLKNEERVSPVCAKSLLTVKRARAKDLRANPGGVDVCKGDIERFCSGEAFGSGAVNRCLQGHLGLKEPLSLSPLCGELQTDIRLDEARDFLANPLMEMQCANERDAYCSSMVDGNSRIQTCLSNKLESIKLKRKAAKKDAKAAASVPAFSSGCERELEQVWLTAELAEAILRHPVSREWVFWSKHAASLRWLHGANVVWAFKWLAALVLITMLWFAVFTVRSGPSGGTQLGPRWRKLQRACLATCLDHNKGGRNA